MIFEFNSLRDLFAHIFAITFTQKNRIFRGVAQLVARDIWDVEAAGSNPVTPTKIAVLTAKFKTARDHLAVFYFTKQGAAHGKGNVF